MAVAPRTVTQPLTQPVFDPDVRRVNFFNGRLLSAEDLQAEQAANQEERRRLGRAIGEGIAYGLEVNPTVGVNTAGAPAITIGAGLAINRQGQTLALGHSVDLALQQLPASAAPPAAIQTFAVCAEASANAYVAGAGAYLLTIGDAEGTQGRAPVSGLGNVQASCNTKYVAPGVRFRLIRLTLEAADLNQPDLLRNRLAYRCLAGSPDGAAGLVTDRFTTNPFGPPITEYGVIDRLRPNLPESLVTGTWLRECEVPLALLYFTANSGLVFVDMWSVRRRLVAPSADARFPLLTGDRRAAEGEAMFLQFQDQIQDLRETRATPETLRAVQHFRYLPPVGILPLANEQFSRGFHEALFFDTLTHAPIVHMEGARVAALVRAALAYPPQELGTGVMLWIYRVRENRQANAPGTPASGRPQPYLVFTTGHMAYMGDPHYDVNRWSYSNYA